jgi:hypothetical protein
MLNPMCALGYTCRSLAFDKTKFRPGPKATRKNPNPADNNLTPIADIARGIDTTLTPEQMAHVARLKKMIHGAKNVPCKLAFLI